MSGADGESGSRDRRYKRLVMLLAASAGIFVVGMIMAVAMMLTKPDSQAYPTGSAQSIPAAGEAGEGPIQTPTPLATPGLVIYGRVQQLDGTGVAGVEIFRRYAGYPGEVVATTNAEGYYLSDFYHIPGDEMVTVWVEAPELRFAPEYYYWRHYYGYEITGHDFTLRRP